MQALRRGLAPSASARVAFDMEEQADAAADRSDLRPRSGSRSAARSSIGSWRMDRLEHMHINPYTAPGLVPGMLGAFIALFGLVMAIRAVRAGALHGGAAQRRRADLQRPRRDCRAALCLAFAAGLVGHGPPFWLAAGDLRLPPRLPVPASGQRASATRSRAARWSRSPSRPAHRVVDHLRLPGAVPGPAALSAAMLEGLGSLGRSLASFVGFWPIAATRSARRCSAS